MQNREGGMLSLFLSLFDDKLVDNRDPWISGLHVPIIDGSFTVFAPEPGPWIQLAAVRDQDDRTQHRHYTRMGLTNSCCSLAHWFATCGPMHICCHRL